MKITNYSHDITVHYFADEPTAQGPMKQGFPDWKIAAICGGVMGVVAILIAIISLTRRGTRKGEPIILDTVFEILIKRNILVLFQKR